MSLLILKKKSVMGRAHVEGKNIYINTRRRNEGKCRQTKISEMTEVLVIS